MSQIAKSILKGAKEALDYARNDKAGSKTHKIKVNVPEKIDVRLIREKLKMNRAEFADNFGFSRRTLEKWEQNIRQPEGAARAYLVVIDRNPKAVESALRKS